MAMIMMTVVIAPIMMTSEGSNDGDDQPDENAGVNEQPEEMPGVDTENGETPGVDDQAETPGLGSLSKEETSGEEITGVGNEDENEEDTEEDELSTAPERTYRGMKLRAQHRKEYDVFTTDGAREEAVIMLQFDDNGELEELDRLDAEYTFLTETLGWAEGLNNEETTREFNEGQVKCLAQYLFVTEQM
jgi:hypothetical protein